MALQISVASLNLLPKPRSLFGNPVVKFSARNPQTRVKVIARRTGNSNPVGDYIMELDPRFVDHNSHIRCEIQHPPGLFWGKKIGEVKNMSLNHLLTAGGRLSYPVYSSSNKIKGMLILSCEFRMDGFEGRVAESESESGWKKVRDMLMCFGNLADIYDCLSGIEFD